MVGTASNRIQAGTIQARQNLIAAAWPGLERADEAGQGKQRRRPKRGDHQDEEIARWRAVAFLGTKKLGQQIGLHRLADELSFGGGTDGGGPGPNHGGTIISPVIGRMPRSHPIRRSAIHRLAMVSRLTIGTMGPLIRMPRPWASQKAGNGGLIGRLGPALTGQVETAKDALRRDAAGQQNGIGLGLMGFADQNEGAANRAAPIKAAAARPGSGRNGRSAAPRPARPAPREDGRPRSTVRRPTGGRSPPASNRWRPAFWPRFVLELDTDVVAALQHLMRRLGETQLVAVDRRNGSDAGQEQGEGESDQQDIGPPVAGQAFHSGRSEGSNHNMYNGKFFNLMENPPDGNETQWRRPRRHGGRRY